KFKLMGRDVPRRMTSSASPAWSGVSSAHGSDPSPPALLTAIAICGVVAPAIGAWMMGTSMPKRSRIRRSGQVPMRSSRIMELALLPSSRIRLPQRPVTFLLAGAARAPPGSLDGRGSVSARDDQFLNQETIAGLHRPRLAQLAMVEKAVAPRLPPGELIAVRFHLSVPIDDEAHQEFLRRRPFDL